MSGPDTGLDTGLEPNRRILVIDDNRAIHEDILKVLARNGEADHELNDDESFLFDTEHASAAGFEVDSAYQGQEGLRKVETALAEGRPYAVAFVDIRMPPGWDGVETISHLWESDPRLQVVICTAYSDYSWTDMRLKLGSSDSLLILKKPFDNVEVAQLAHALTQKWMVTRQAGEQTAELERKLAWCARVERDLRTSQERYALAARGANDGIWDWDLENLAVYFAPRWQEMLGFAEGEIAADIEEWLSRVHPEDRERLRTQLDARLKRGGPNEFISEHRIRHRDGTYRWMLNRAVVLRAQDGVPLRIAGSQTDVTQNKAFDALTALPNRVLFSELIARALEIRRNGSMAPFGVMFIDLDGFKDVNDSLGHSAGDRLLVEVARRLERAVGAAANSRESASDVVARFGGDEFAVLIDCVAGQEEAASIAAEIGRALLEPLQLEGKSIALSASIGLALWNRYYATPQELLRDADTAMYQAKRSGRSRVAVFDAGMRLEMMERLALENDLRLAVDRHELVVEYQPVRRFGEAGSGRSDGKLAGFEALVRWRHPTRGLLMPAQFIPVAEGNGLIVPLGEFVLREACSAMKRWSERYPRETPLDIAVNLSPRQLRDPDLVERVGAILRTTGLDPAQLKLEITESMLIDDSPSVLEALNTLKRMGIRLEIDDFGTGYSCLSYLPLLPCKSLKIDRSFVMKMHKDVHSLEIVRAILALAHNLKMSVIAEGIETQAQLNSLREYGCLFGQGLYFSGPLSGEDAQRMVERAAVEQWVPEAVDFPHALLGFGQGLLEEVAG